MSNARTLVKSIKQDLLRIAHELRKIKSSTEKKQRTKMLKKLKRDLAFTCRTLYRIKVQFDLVNHVADHKYLTLKRNAAHNKDLYALKEASFTIKLAAQELRLLGKMCVTLHDTMLDLLKPHSS